MVWMLERLKRVLVAKGAILFLLLYSSPVMAAAEGAMAPGAEEHVWWFWPLVLLVVTFVMGVLAVLEAASSLSLSLAGFFLSISILCEAPGFL
jgi:hypothetical protein